MKSIQKKTTLLIIVVVSSLLTFAFSLPEDSSGILTVRTTEVINGMWDNSMTTVYPDGSEEKVVLEKLKMKDLSSNLKTVNQHLNSLISKGYQVHSVSGGNGEGMIVTTYTLVKE